MDNTRIFTVFILVFILSLAAGCIGTPQTTTPVPTATGVVTPPSHEICTTPADCIPAQCCHATSCIGKAHAPDCTNIMCTQVCSGPLDCGAGHCGCVNGTCSIIPATSAGA